MPITVTCSGDHHGWQKEGFFEASTRVPYLVSWPERLRPGPHSSALVCLTDLFGIATTAAGRPDLRQGSDVLGQLLDGADERETLFGYHGTPGTEQFKAMVRTGDLKLIWMCNGGERLLFDVAADPDELDPLQDERPDETERLYELLVRQLLAEGVGDAFDGDVLHTVAYREWPRRRIYQFDASRGVTGFGA